MKKILLFLLLINYINAAFTQDQNKIINLRFDARFDAEAFIDSDSKTKNKSGFGGKYLKIIANGDISDKFSYNFRHRLYLNAKEDYKSYFNSTDWAYLNYKINKNFTLSAGKQVVMIGGYEYDLAPIDVYFWSNFWNNVNCYQLGGMINFTSSDKKHNLGFQITNSPFSKEALQGIYAYNLIWYGDFDWFKTIYSANIMEYKKGQYMNYIALGNQLDISDFTLQIDYMNRMRLSNEIKKPFSNFTLIGNLSYKLCDKLNIFVKGGYDQNKSQEENAGFSYDKVVPLGTEYMFYGLGAEFFPIKNKKDVRIHAFWASNNSSPKFHNFNVGLRWQMKVLER